ncbi:pyridoxamine 5'-phosphate oxidase family protein [Streptomyces sp. NBC_00582]|uniref:pyridoxamine 5'-phosphate oxidase family protein n=1 Tax=Streptomyces sp. NBC_00582 TaxID=2975783 RepID=UPI001062F2B9|nr:pyridoxamine 5'-phosphate oxidase family protein [Streptomyces sp. NBC_00582]WUB60060.1 pyridoxamine 5'-phosphate oxidase family protein [Streptomyces sp. NBC_00582]
MTRAPARTALQRKHDTLHRLEQDVDVWVATAAEDGAAPYLAPLSYVWDGAVLLVATPVTAPTGRALLDTRVARLAVGPADDVVMIEGTAAPVPPAELPEEDAEIFAGKTGFDPRELPVPHLYFLIRPRRIRSWRTREEETGGCEVMRDGEWLVTG